MTTSLVALSTTPLAAIEAPSVEYAALSPMLIVFSAGVIGVLVEAFAPRRLRYALQLALSLGGLVVALAALATVTTAQTADGANGQFAMSGAVVMDRPTLYLQGLLLIIAIIAVGFMAERRLERVVAPVTMRTLAGAEVGDDQSGRTGLNGGGVDADMFTPSGASVPNTDAEFEATRAGAVTTEVFPLALLAVGGMMLFPACGDLLTMFIALEVFSLPLYLLCGLARRRRLISQEASLKYFLLGAFSSAFFLFGAAFVYGATGSLNLSTIGASLTDVAGTGGDTTLALIGLAMLAVGLLFKVGAVPFHSWIPDVYQGAPTPVTAFMASATKVAAFGALLRVFYVGFGALRDQWEPALWAVAIASMVIASVMAVTQNDIKRMLAYSSIAHAGFILLGLIAFDDAGLGATLFYLAAYAFTTLGAFAMVAVIREPDCDTTTSDTSTSARTAAIHGTAATVRNPHLSGREATDLTQWSGLGRRYPLVGAMFAVYLLSFAGIPLTSGFIAKFDVFAAVAGNGGGVLVVIGVISSAIAAYVYIRIIVAMFFDDVPTHDAPHVVKPSILTTTGIAICTLATVVLGIFPQPLLDLADAAATFLR
ncbi:MULTISPECIES: NADH-quinone oxidoreductase subunit NuoN [Gordonia]|uniref:NADH-quinone oxidoreductase subunit N n=1 Tax=Gordonia alkanivorans CGMCC 6845 TaxID=1423140 RepID=W9DEA4_9ACTN|nr:MULTISPECIES: NADH-quinone oxidoreductase subunit NuoN [Gordonia]ETA07818.1 NADH:ubiquinone oxidoreductase subunit N [Gordonia alkanivorans CGMCC 6845]MDH3009164.1 NADH-quinone oxidoreductase subunit NuoN [Gordonia alkanivorans]MDH3012987.1 NADH-quinone oxidoreductase subunit NuoN [Gordonia alkanivorans]MDH3015134.1 NADH-quinone oxidoreductase subunit NuoN [Gordonia alkanivorans]MDH3024187.1 NADH-quinone oxidoreductase subunit NuoN [Gordonia alkanivorans]